MQSVDKSEKSKRKKIEDTVWSVNDSNQMKSGSDLGIRYLVFAYQLIWVLIIYFET